MLSGLAWLALEVKYLDRARRFYEDHLELDVRRADERAVVLAAGDTDVTLRRPDAAPRGGLHTHYAFSIPAEEYRYWYDRLDAHFDLEEVTFGDATSLYLDDPDDHCVELGQSAVDGPGIDGIFEVVLEVTDLDRAENRYTALGFEPVDRGSSRRRVRLRGPMDLELWEPQLGLADARGGVHVDLGFRTDDPERALAAIEDEVCEVLDRSEDRVVVRERDGHVLTFLRE